MDGNDEYEDKLKYLYRCCVGNYVRNCEQKTLILLIHLKTHQVTKNYAMH